MADNDGVFVITRPDPTSGLGANLLSMVGALYASERTGRSLIVDWTGMAPLRDKQTNYFVAFFEPIRRWRTVDIFYVNDSDDPSRDVQYQEGDLLRPTDQQYVDVLEGRIDRRPVLLGPFHYYRVFRRSPLSQAAIFHYTREFYQCLTPRPHLRARLASLKPGFERKIVIGLHVRSGNGEFSAGSPYQDRVKTAIFDWPTFSDRAYRACCDCLSGFPDALRSDMAVYVATDGRDMQERLLRMPGAFAARQRFPPAGAGHQFADFRSEEYGEYTDIESANETIIDMFLLAECRGLVCNDSAFNHYAQYMTMFFNGNVKPLERYFEHPFKRFGRELLRTLGRGRARPATPA